MRLRGNIRNEEICETRNWAAARRFVQNENLRKTKKFCCILTKVLYNQNIIFVEEEYGKNKG